MDLMAITQSASSIVRFIQGGELSDILSTIGGVHFQAASNVLKNAKDETNPREAVNRALSHLEVAQLDYKNDIDSLLSKSSPINLHINMIYLILTYILIIICHKDLENSKIIK